MSYIQLNMTGKTGKKSKQKEHSDFIQSLLHGGAASGDSRVHGQLVVKNQSAITHTAPPAKAATAVVADTEEDDIFGDAGKDYVPEIPDKQKRAQAAAGASQRPDGSYFDTKDDMSDLPPPPPPPGEADMDIEEGELAVPPPPPLPPGGYPAPPSTSGYGYGVEQGGYYGQQQAGVYGDIMAGYPGYDDATAGPSGVDDGAGYQPTAPRELTQADRDAGLASVFKSDEKKWRPTKPSEASKQALSGFADDAYAECFPEYHDVAAELADSDDEGAPPAAQGGNAAGTAVAAAAGPGAGRAGAAAAAAGGGGKGDLGGRKKEHKLDGQLHKIQRMFVDKGYGNEAAFKKQAALEIEATPSRKKQRI